MKSIFLNLSMFLAIVISFDSSKSTNLFDGESLSGWTSLGSKAGNWRAEGGVLLTKGDGKGWLSSNRSFEDFELSLEYKIGRAGNTGVLIRAPHRGDPSFDGMEIQILDDAAPIYAKLKPEQYTGSVYGVIAAKRGHSKPAGEWNSMKIRVEGSKIVVELNGAKVVDGDLENHSESLPRHGGLSRRSGFIGLQSHESPAAFRKIVLREIR